MRTTKRMPHPALLLLLLLPFLFTPARAATLDACGKRLPLPDALAGTVSAICGLNQPEDFAVTPDGRNIVVGDLGMTMDAKGIHPPTGPVEMAQVDTVTGRVRRLGRIWDNGADWGDPACHARDRSGPFFVLGMDISYRRPGIVQLLLVNTIGGPHVEFYQLIQKDVGLAAAWRGCVETPGAGSIDAVAALPGGGFVASVLCAPEYVDLAACIGASKRGEETGWLLSWHRGQPVLKLPHSDAQLNNGLAVSPGGDQIYTVVSGQDSLKVYSLAAGRFVRTIDLAFSGDNARAGPPGWVIVGGTSSGNFCLGRVASGCTNSSWVMAVETSTGRRELLFHALEGLLSGTTGGIVVRGRLYVSSLSDPFLLRVQLQH